ncbi:flagellar basal body rod protein FlgG [Clostridium sp. SYSU_GA19001]|uniref:flagellar hook-basal body complex protein n=1 Tax=Clostridium caldaquaticum TaxID=2940653 RepID=UPI002077778A|nr:flagellar hook-basal body complex protein [Clostridium caldaquaticum]MCM8710990.1 flagellar basal body rod protein FlgG [Clostridium caldaquaticum]
MIRSLYTSISGLITQEAKQNVITNNLANANTVGFKSDNLSVKRFNDVLIENYDKIEGGKNVKNVIGSLSQGSSIDGVSTSFTQGIIESTDKWSDFAIEGRGFFSVAREINGINTTFYSRDGHFHVNNEGYLVNDSGDYVLAARVDFNGQPIGAAEPILVGNEELQLNSDGSFNLNGDRYKFSIVDFENYDMLTKIGDNLFSGQNPVDYTNGSVKQKSLEKSNVNIMTEMVNMITAFRTFESNQKIIQSIDETLGKAVNEVGSVR